MRGSGAPWLLSIFTNNYNSLIIFPSCVRAPAGPMVPAQRGRERAFSIFTNDHNSLYVCVCMVHISHRSIIPLALVDVHAINSNCLLRSTGWADGSASKGLRTGIVVSQYIYKSL